VEHSILEAPGAPSLEHLIVAGLIENRGVYDAFKRYGSTEGLTPVGRHLVDLVGGYYELDGSAGAVPIAVIEQRAERELTNPKHADAVKRYLRQLPSHVSAANTVHDIREHRRRTVGDKLSLALANRSPETDALLQEYQALETAAPGATAHNDTEVVDVFDTEDLVNENGAEERLIRLWPKALNDRCDGGAKPGHHILVFGRPNAGKSLVSMNMAAGFLHQQLDVAYFQNEEPAADVRMRMRQRLLKKTKQEIRNNRARAAEALSKAKLGKLHIVALSPGTFPEIDRIVGELSPHVIVIDQLRNVRISAGSRVEELEAAAIQARNLGKRRGLLVVSVTQAGDSASGKAALTMSDVDNSKTGIPGAVDLMVGVACTKVMEQAGLLSITTLKNKLGQIEETFQVRYNKQTGVIF